MSKTEYLLDANIVIKLWKSNPEVLDKIEEVQTIDYKITKNIAGELSAKEYRNYKGVPILTDKFLKLLDHIIEIEDDIYDQIGTIKADIRYDNRKNIYYINDNKVSANDFSLVAFCMKYSQYILVTEDKKIYESVKNILGPSRVLNFNQFIKDINKVLE